MVALSLQDFICEHYGEDSSVYKQEIKELMELRQVIESATVRQLSSRIKTGDNKVVMLPTGDAHPQP